MEYNLKTDVSNICDKYYSAIYKDFVFIEDNMEFWRI